MKAKKRIKKGLAQTFIIPALIIMYTFIQEVQADVAFGQDPGQSPVLLFQDLNQFSLPLALPATLGSAGATLTITGSHAFPSGVGFIQFTSYMDGPEVSGKTTGEPGFTVKKNALKITIVGDSAIIKEKCENLRNRPLIWLFRDPAPGSTRWQQLGTEENPAVVESIEQMGGNKTKGGTKGYVITVASIEQVYDYQGTIIYNS